MTVDQLEELKARLTAASEPDDLRPAWELSELKRLGYGAGWNNLDCAVFEQMWDAGGHLSAVIALTEAVLPEGWRRSASMRTANGWRHFISDGVEATAAHMVTGWHKSEPIALLLATIDALIERAKNDD